MRHMRILLLLLDHLPTIQRMHPLRIHPMAPARRIACKHVPRENAVAAGVLDVDVKVATFHREDDVEVYLKFVGDAFLDAKEVGFMAMVPTKELGEGEDSGDYDESEGGVAAGGAAASIGGFCFCFSRLLERAV